MTSKGIMKPVAITGRISWVKDSTITIEWSGDRRALSGLIKAQEAGQDLEIVIGPAREE